MFTGLVEAVGRLRRMERRGPSASALVEAPFDDLALGDSVSVCGACLTVTRLVPGGFEADLSAETLALTTLGALGAGSRVNLERASKLGSRLGGHIVLGHVDGVGRVVEKTLVGDAFRTGIELDAALAPFVAPKGSVAVDGVSLTVNTVVDGAASVTFGLMLIPHTLSATTLEGLKQGDRVNVEVDVLARYVARQRDLATSRQVGVFGADERPHKGAHHDPTGPDDRLLDKLRRGGW